MGPIVILEGTKGRVRPTGQRGSNFTIVDGTQPREHFATDIDHTPCDRSSRARPKLASFAMTSIDLARHESEDEFEDEDDGYGARYDERRIAYEDEDEGELSDDGDEGRGVAGGDVGGGDLARGG